MEKNPSKVDLMHHVEAPVAQGEIPEFRAGDTVKVHVRVVEDRSWLYPQQSLE